MSSQNKNTPPSEFNHIQPFKTGVLLLNLGTPDSPTVSAVRRYLDEFLSDPRVIDKPRWLWWFILHGIILRLRPRRSAHAYQKVWTEQGSPLLTISQSQADKLQAQLSTQFPHVLVELGMRYGSPSVDNTLKKFKDKNINNLIILPLYPQYSATTTASTLMLSPRLLKNGDVYQAFISLVITTINLNILKR